MTTTTTAAPVPAFTEGRPNVTLGELHEGAFVRYGVAIRRVTFFESPGGGWVAIAFDGSSSIDRRAAEPVHLLTRSEIVAMGAREGSVDAETALDHGLDLTTEEALETLFDNSEDYASIVDVEVRAAYLTAYVEAFTTESE